MEITKGASQKVFDRIVSARAAQGEKEYSEASEEEKKEIIQRWCDRVAGKKKTRKEQKRLKKTESKSKGKEKETN